MRRIVSVVTLIALLAAACGDDAASDTSTSSPEAAAPATTVPDAPATTVSPTTVAPTTLPPTTAPTTTVAPGGGGGADCLVGTWEIDTDAYVAELQRFADEQLPGQDFTMSYIGGNIVIDLARDGTFAADRQDFELGVEAAEGEIRMTMTGVDRGTWSADDDTLTIDSTETTGEVEVVAIVEGTRIALPNNQAPIQVDSTGGGGSYSCDGDTMVFTPTDEQTFSTPLRRVQ